MFVKTGGGGKSHWGQTRVNYLHFEDLAPEIVIISALPAFTNNDYYRPGDSYLAAGIDSTAEPRVGLGFGLPAEPYAPAQQPIGQLHDEGLKLQGFGLKTVAFQAVGSKLASADSLAWSYADFCKLGLRPVRTRQS
ncbi:DUF7221 family queuine tRNA-ribosyltransferase-like protein [Lentzea jiangxiensis]|uniref:DeoxyPurine in DNA protein A domain-containing protein n=1 Tax=Lentzea jiangxiensis TaxID=641025 RepID=A0A1H0X693_9PSEU|nr:hypothetical protein [Lentzea jiangxiensis]SDP98468.1 hypothetical protein SAMN05421507_1402 [Lentzea jiangxiensis]